MAERKLFGKTVSSGGDEATPEGVPLGGTREEAMQRLQIGVFGICSMVLLVGLASIIGTQAELTEQAAVPEAAPTTEPTEAPPQRDPLVDAGVVPDIPVEPSPSATPTGTPPVAPEQGVDNPAGPPSDTPRN